MWVRLWSRLWQYDASALLGIDHTHVPECAAPHETFQFKKTLVTALSIFFIFFPVYRYLEPDSFSVQQIYSNEV